jgi:hypothetical protein
MSERNETAKKIFAASVPVVLAAVAGALINARCTTTKPPSPVTATSASGSSSSANPSATAAATANPVQSVSLTVNPPAATPAPPPKETTVVKKYDVRSDHQSGGITAAEVHIDQSMSPEDRAELLKLRAQRKIDEEYSDSAKLNVSGGEHNVMPPMIEKGDIADAMRPGVSMGEGHYDIKCDPAAIAAFKKTATAFPKFPFSFYALTDCLRQAGDDHWRSYARTAIGIFEKTTTVAGHNGNHDQALANLRLWNP